MSNVVRPSSADRRFHIDANRLAIQHLLHWYVNRGRATLNGFQCNPDTGAAWEDLVFSIEYFKGSEKVSLLSVMSLLARKSFIHQHQSHCLSWRHIRCSMIPSTMSTVKGSKPVFCYGWRYEDRQSLALMFINSLGDFIFALYGKRLHV